MSDESSIEEQLRRRAEQITRDEAALVRHGNSLVVQAFLGTVPWTGGIGAALSKIATQRQEVRLREFLLDVAKSNADLARQQENAIDYKFLESDEFVGILVTTLEEAGKTADAERMRYLRLFLGAAALSRRPDVGWLDLFQRYLGRLSGVHIALLDRIYDLQRGYSARDRLGGRRLRNVPVCVDEFRRSTYSYQLVRVSLADLANLGLLADWRLLSLESEVQECYTMTRNGYYFARYVLGEWGNQPSQGPPLD